MPPRARERRGEGEEEPSQAQAPPLPCPTPALPLTQALSQAVAVSEDYRKSLKAYDSITWEERQRRVVSAASV